MENEMIPSLAQYQPKQRERLRALMDTPEWKEILSRKAFLEQLRSSVKLPASSPSQQASARGRRSVPAGKRNEVHVPSRRALRLDVVVTHAPLAGAVEEVVGRAGLAERLVHGLACEAKVRLRVRE